MSVKSALAQLKASIGASKFNSAHVALRGHSVDSKALSEIIGHQQLLLFVSFTCDVRPKTWNHTVSTCAFCGALPLLGALVLAKKANL